MVSTNSGEGQTWHHYPLPALSKLSHAQCYQYRTFMNSEFTYFNKTCYSSHLTFIMFKKHKMEKKHLWPETTLQLTFIAKDLKFFFFFFFANNNASLLYLAFCNIAGNSQKGTLMWIAAVQFKAKQASNFRGSGCTKCYFDTLQSCKHFPVP